MIEYVLLDYSLFYAQLSNAVNVIKSTVSINAITLYAPHHNLNFDRHTMGSDTKTWVEAVLSNATSPFFWTPCLFV